MENGTRFEMYDTAIANIATRFVDPFNESLFVDMKEKYPEIGKFR